MPATLPGAVELGALAIAATAGALLFFCACVLPMASLRLDADVAGRFVRALFPACYGFCAGGSVVAAILCAGAAPAAAALSLAACLAFLFARQVLLPAIDAARDAAMADTGSARRFRHLHRAGLAISALQVVLLLMAFAFAVERG